MSTPLASVLRDPERLAALGATELMDSPPEPVFDRLTELAARELGVPRAVMSLVDERRQFFKSSTGVTGEVGERRGTPLSHSFCQHVVHTGTPLRVEDAREHPLVRDNLAVRDLEVIAYLGIPLVTDDGHVIGSFCAIDAEPREWTNEDAERLTGLARRIMREIAHRDDERLRTFESVQPEGADFDLRAVVDAACERIAGEALRRGLQVTAWIDSELPATLHGDERAAAPDARPPAGQRDRLHAGRPRRRPRARTRRRHRADRDRRHRHRDRAGGARARLRAVLSDLRGRSAASRRRRPRPARRAAAGGAARRRPRRALAPGRRLDVPLHGALRGGA